MKLFGNEHSSSHSYSKLSSNVYNGISDARTKEKLSVETECLENIWASRLKEQNWLPRCANRLQFHWAQSTIALYNRLLTKFKVFCSLRDLPFPPTNSVHCSALLAEFLCDISDSSGRPASLLLGMSAAISCLYESFGYKSHMNIDIALLKSALVKSGTKLPAQRTPVMPCVPLYRLFQSWKDTHLSVKLMRVRAISLLALCCMTRPSDLAPKCAYVDSVSHEVVPLTLSMNQVVFQADKSITITFYVIKYD